MRLNKTLDFWAIEDDRELLLEDKRKYSIFVDSLTEEQFEYLQSIIEDMDTDDLIIDYE